MKKLIIYLLMTVWMGVSIVLLCNEDESAALLPSHQGWGVGIVPRLHESALYTDK